MTPTPQQKALATAAMLAVVGGLAYHLRSATADGDGLHATVAWAGTPPATVECLEATSLATQPVLNLFRLRPDAGPTYCVARVCYDATTDAGAAALPAGMDVLFASERTAAYDGGPQVEVWCAPSADAPWGCACTAGGDCQSWQTAAIGAPPFLAPAPYGATLGPGLWQGGCVPKPCVELAGVSSWPAACPTSAPDAG